MTARSPLYYDSGNLIEMTAAEILEWNRQAIYQYASAPTVVLTVDAGNGNISGGALSDTKYKSSTATQQASSYATPGSLGTTTVAFEHIVQTITNPAVTGDTNNVLFPVYQDNTGGTIQAMTETDFEDTFIKPAIDLMVAASEAVAGDYGGTYAIGTSTSLSNHTNVSTTAVFTDTSADISEYAAGDIGTAGTYQTDNETVQSYYLHRRDAVDNSPARTPLHADTSGNLNEFAAATFKGYLAEYIKDLAASDDSAADHNLRYNVNGSGDGRGTAMLDQKYDSDSTGQITVGGDDYRSQKFPAGSLATTTTYTFKVNKE